MNIFQYLYKFVRKLRYITIKPFNTICTKIIFKGNGVIYGRNVVSNGVPIIDVWSFGKMEIGHNFSMNNGKMYNKIGRQQQCIFVVKSNAILRIGNNVGMSGVAIVCHEKIVIKDRVKIGGNVVIYDTDFHSKSKEHRFDKQLDTRNTNTAPVLIDEDVFIGAHCTILKGVHIESNVIIGACSVITKSIPANQVWGGNPAKFIRLNEA